MHLSLTAVLPDLSLLPLPFVYVVVGVMGAIIGSFLNVVIHRLPREESIVLPSSRCPGCGVAIAFYDNVPVLSYVLLGGRCRSCKAHISARYPAVEALTAALWVFVVWRDGLTWALPFDLIFVTAITALIFIDAEHMLLPNKITYPGIVFALVARLALPYLMGRPYFDDLNMLVNGPLAGMPLWAASLVGAFIGALVGGGSLWLMGWTWEKLRGIEAMGLGDVKMMFMVGAYLGWRVNYSDNLSGCPVRISHWYRDHVVRRQKRFEELPSIRSIFGNRRDDRVVFRIPDHHLVHRFLPMIY